MNWNLDFMIIGAQKCATTTLYDWLRQHPDIFLPKNKELPFFHEVFLQRKPKDFIDICYAESSNYEIVGGAWVNLMYYSFLVKKMCLHNKSMKCISILRNPIDRAYSNYWYAHGLEIEPCNTFEKALQAEGKRINGTVIEQSTLTYLTHGHYAEQLKPYLDHFGQENIFVDTVDMLKNDKNIFIKNILNFLLGSSTGFSKIDTTKKSNVSSKQKIPYIMSILLSPDGWHKKIGRKFVPAKGQAVIREQVINKLIQLNRKPFKYPPMLAQTRQRLVDYYYNRNENLSKLLGRDFSFWNK